MLPDVWMRNIPSLLVFESPCRAATGVEHLSDGLWPEESEAAAVSDANEQIEIQRQGLIYGQQSTVAPVCVSQLDSFCSAA